MKRNELPCVAIRAVEEAPLISSEEMRTPGDAVRIVCRFLEEMDREYFCIVNLQSDTRPICIKVADRIIRSSKCPVRELAQDRAFYSPLKDEIILPLRSRFKDDVSFLKTLVHECCHSTAAPDRLNRQLGGVFGSPEYAKEELRAEIGALFTETDLHVPLQGEHYEDHSDYLRSWISILQDDYNEFFRACSDAEQISQYLLENYSSCVES